MDELTTRLATIEARLTAVELLAETTSRELGDARESLAYLQEMLEERIERRRVEIRALEDDLRRLVNELRYDIDRATQAAERVTRRW